MKLEKKIKFKSKSNLNIENLKQEKKNENWHQHKNTTTIAHEKVHTTKLTHTTPIAQKCFLPQKTTVLLAFRTPTFFSHYRGLAGARVTGSEFLECESPDSKFPIFACWMIRTRTRRSVGDRYSQFRRQIWGWRFRFFFAKNWFCQKFLNFNLWKKIGTSFGQPCFEPI